MAADLAFNSIAYGDLTVPAGAETRVNVDIRNNSEDDAAGPSTIGFYISTDPTSATPLDDVSIGTLAIGGIGAQGAGSYNFDFTWDRVGTYYLYVALDARNEVAESNETNNAGSVMRYFVGVQPEPEKIGIQATHADRVEGSDNAFVDYTFTVTRSDAFESRRVFYTLDFNGDHPADILDVRVESLDGRLDFARGESSKTIVIKVRSDTLREFDETFQVRLTSASRATIDPDHAVATGIIRDDDSTVPTAISLSGATIAENAAAGTVIGTLSATASGGGAVTWSLDAGSADAFAIVGDVLRSKASFDHEATPTRAVTVIATDAFGAATSKTLTIEVSDVEEAPHTVRLSKATVAENSKVGTTIGTLSGVDPDGKALAWALTDSAGGLFKLSGAKLQTAKVIDYERVQSDTVTVEAKDAGGLTVKKTFTVGITDVVETITGNDGPNKLTGGIGSDGLNGRRGNDVLKGGDGKDTFVFDTTPGDRNVDRISDFSHKDDTFKLWHGAFKGLGEGHLSSKRFVEVTDPFTSTKIDSNDRILFDRKDGDLYFDRDGSGDRYDPVKFAEVRDRLTLDHTDFLVV